MKLLRKSIINLKSPVKVYDLETTSNVHNFCLGNGVVVHNSKDISDAVVGVVYNLYQHIDQAGQMSKRYKAETHKKFYESRIVEVKDTFQDMIQGIY